MHIFPYTPAHFQDLKQAMESLQDSIVEIDPEHLNTRSEGYGEAYTQKLLENVDSHQGLILMAYDDANTCIGCIAGTIETNDEREAYEMRAFTRGIVIELFVSPQARGQGIWGKLMESMEQYFKANHCEYSYLEVFHPNTSAIKFYEKWWYSPRMHLLQKKL